MPELPEVETLCSQLRQVILGTVIRDIDIIDPKLQMISEAVGRCVTAVTRRGKAVEIHLDNDKAMVLHLRMTGRLEWQHDQQGLPAHARFTIAFPQGRIVCIDPRRFATLTIRDNPPCGALISDPLQDCAGIRLKEIAGNRKLPVKSFLMDQRWIAGIGNIYACEMLYEASVNPWRKVCSLSLREWECIAAAAKLILARAVACRGTTISDWRDLFGLKGEYQDELSVYARHGRPCLRCHGMIQRERLSGRGTYFCPSCQK
jgi:formamidopyrimidine-DNA glycosylase